MERLKSTVVIFFLAVGLFTSAVPAKPASVLLQEGLYAEEIEGDLDAAIKIYEQVISKSKETKRAAAQATYRIGMCYQKKGQKDKAAEYFQNIILNFPSQKALVTKAEKQLDQIKPRPQRIVERAVKTISTCAEGDPRVTKALESLKGLDENVVANELVKFLDSETDTVRRSAIYILWKGDLKDISSAVPALDKLCSHEEEFTRGMAALALGQAKVNSSFDTLCDMTLKDNSGYARRCGAIALGWMGRADAKPILEKALEDSDRLVRNNAKTALAMLPEKVRPLTRVFEPQALDEQLKSGEVPSFKVQIHDNTALDLDSGEIALLKDEWPDRFDVAWDNDGGGVLMKKAGSGIRFLALPSGEKQTWDKAIYMARSDIDELRNSNTRGIWASRGKFAAVLTSEGNLAVIQIGEYDANKGTIYGWVEKIPAASFSPAIERFIYDPASYRECFIDFESGEIFKIPEPLRDPNISPARAFEWFTATGIDAQGDTGGSPRSHGLVGFPPYNAAAVEAPGGWNATPETLIAMTRQLTAVGKSKMFAKDPLPTTYYFKTRQGNVGVLQILGFTTGDPRGVKFRYKMLQEPEKTAPVEVFGPVIERLIDSDETDGDIFFDLDTAQAYSFPPGLTRASPTSEKIEWSKTKGIDFANDRGRMELVDMTAVKIKIGMWESATPVELRDALLKGTAQDFLPSHSKDYTISSPFTYAFETREGGIGLLQILDKKNENLQIRYKMLRPVAVKETVNLNVGKPAYEWWQSEPSVTNTIYEDSQLEIVWDVEPEMAKKILSFGGGVLPMKGDISDTGGHLWWVRNLAFTVRRTPYGKKWGITKGPKPLKSGEYRIYICAFDSKENIVWRDMLRKNLVGAATAKLIVRPRPSTQTATPREVKSPIDLSTPEATIKSFVKAVYVGNLEAAKACVSKDGHDYEEFMEMLATESNHPFQAMIKAMDASIPVEITSKDITEDRCKIKWYFTLGRVYYIGDGETKWKKGMHPEFSSYLELVGDKWLIRDI